MPQASTQGIAAPQTREQLDALSARRSELRDQLQSVGERRRELADQRQHLEGADARSLDARIAALDARSARLEADIQKADDAVSEALTRGITVTPDPFQQIAQDAMARAGRGSGASMPRMPGANDRMAQAMIFEGFGFVLLGFILWRYTWRRAEKKFSRPPAADQSSRFDQLQQAVDVIAIEMERVSEGQRYVTKVLEKLQPSIGAGEAQPIGVARKSAEPARASDDRG